MFEEFLFLALAAILFNGAEALRPFWISDRHNFSLFPSIGHPVATEQVSAQSNQMLGTDFQDGGHFEFSFRSISHFVSTKRPNIHH